MISAVVGRDLGRNYQLEIGYLGRLGRDLLIRRDLAMPLNLTDSRSGMDYFTAAQTIIRAAQARGITGTSPASAYQALANLLYWENLFPAAAGNGLSATQAITRFDSDFRVQDTGKRMNAIHSLARTKNDLVTERLGKLLSHPDHEIRMGAAMALDSMSHNPDKAGEILPRI